MGEAKHTLFTCITCDPGKAHNEPNNMGNRMHLAAKEAVAADAALGAQMDVQPVSCIGGCDHPCTIALAGPKKITWVFTHQGPDTVGDILETAKLYISRAQGQMLPEERAPALQLGAFCKIPAIK